MAHSRPKRFTNWYLRDWLAHTKVSQAQLADKTELGSTAVSLLFNDRQDYTPKIIQVVATALNIAPFELLMHPDDAASLKRLRAAGLQAVESGKAFDQPTGTGG